MRVEIKDTTVKELEKRSKDTGSKDVTAYINYILEQVVERLHSEKPQKKDKDEERAVRERLRSLGYVD